MNGRIETTRAMVVGFDTDILSCSTDDYRVSHHGVVIGNSYSRKARMPTQSGILDTLLDIIDGRPGAGAACVRGTLGVLAGLHRVGLEIELATYALGWARVTRLPAEVVAVGNLSLGGTGKTLAVLKLAREYLAAGKRVAVLSRGHGRTSHNEQVVIVTPGNGAPPSAEVGDEPSVLAASLPGTPILIGKNRRSTGRRAIDEFGADVLILDDGFQYWRLHKDREIVLIDALQPPAREHLLPRGIFREPWAHLRRAHEVWITHARLADADRIRALAARIARCAPAATIRYTEHHPTHLRTPQGRQAPMQTLLGHQVLALSGLGNPRQFEVMLAALGARVTPCRFPDHHRYTPADLNAIAAQLAPNRLLVTTAKDAVRLPLHLPFPVWVVEVELAEVAMPGG